MKRKAFSVRVKLDGSECKKGRRNKLELACAEFNGFFCSLGRRHNGMHHAHTPDACIKRWR